MKVKIGKESLEVDLQFADLVKTDDSSLTPHTDDLSARRMEQIDPVGSLLEKAQFDEALATRTSLSHDALMKSIWPAMDVRDEPTAPRKNDWDEQVSDGARETAAERFFKTLDRVFAGHPEEAEEMRQIARRFLIAERQDILPTAA